MIFELGFDGPIGVYWSTSYKRALQVMVEKCTSAVIFHSLNNFIEYLFGIWYIKSITLAAGAIEDKSQCKGKHREGALCS